MSVIIYGINQATKSGQTGYVKIPILNIRFHRIVIDMLHLFLRITNFCMIN
jgi:hypothetical protein